MSSVDARSHNIKCICDETRKDGQLEVSCLKYLRRAKLHPR